MTQTWFVTNHIRLNLHFEVFIVRNLLFQFTISSLFVVEIFFFFKEAEYYELYSPYQRSLFFTLIMSYGPEILAVY